MNFEKAYCKMERGDKIRRKAWGTGVYWEKMQDGDIYQVTEMDKPDEKNRIIVISITEAKAVDWEVMRDLNFGEAIEKAKDGYLIARRGWIGKGLAVAYRNGYEDIPCNRPHSEAWGIPVGEAIKLRPYLQMRCADGDYQMWTASQSDILAEDWFVTH